MPVPQTVANSFIDELNEALSHPYPPSEFDLRRWERSAKALLPKGAVEAADGYQLLGMLRVFSGDAVGIRENFLRAIRLVPSNRVIQMNYVVALDNALYSQEAFAYLSSLGIDTLVKEGGRTLACAIWIVASSGHFKSAEAMLDQREETNMLGSISRSNLDVPLLRTLSRCVSMIEGGEEAFAKCLDSVEALLRTKLEGRFFSVTQEYGYSEECGGRVIYRLPVSIDEAVTINFEIADILADQIDGPLEYFPAISVLPHANYS